MFIKKINDVKKHLVKQEGVKDTYIQILINEDNAGAENFAMRRFTVKPAGVIGLHSHDWEHEIFILQGQGIIEDGESKIEVEKDTAIYIPPNVKHSYKNTGREDLVFLCLIPIRD